MNHRNPYIVFAATSDPNHDQRMLRICRAYQEKGYRVNLCGRRLPTSLDEHKQPFPIHRFSCFFLRGKAFYLEFNLRLLVYLLRHRPSWVWAADLDTMAAAWLYTSITGSRMVYDAHEYYTETPELQGRPATKRIWEILAKKVIPSAAICITVNQSLAEILGKRYKVPFLTIRNVSLARKVTPSESGKINPPVILYQGVLNVGRGLETAITAMHQLPGMQLWLAGEGDCSTALRILVSKENLDDRVKFLGKLLPDALAAITPRVFTGINLLDGDSKNYYYSLANKTFDYVQAGIPAIHMDFPEYRRHNEEWECFVLLPALDPESLAGAVRALLDHPEKHAHLQANCALAANEWNWDEEKKLLPEL